MITHDFAFFNREAPGVPRHLWMVLSDPNQDANTIVIANFSTKPGLDNPAIEARPGEHPGISRLSYLRCEKARTVSAAQLNQLIQDGSISQTHNTPDGLLRRMRAALANSQYTPKGIKSVLAQQRLV